MKKIIILLTVFCFMQIIEAQTLRASKQIMYVEKGRDLGTWSTLCDMNSPMIIRVKRNMITIDNAVKDTFRLGKIIDRWQGIYKSTNESFGEFLYEAKDNKNKSIKIAIIKSFAGIDAIQIIDDSVQYAFVKKKK